MTTLLRAKNITVKFGSLKAVNDISFELAGGELLGLIGPNGAGKTTLLRALAGLLAPSQGRAEIMDIPVIGEDEAVRRQIGFAPDSSPAYDGVTIDQFLRFIAGMYGLDAGTTEERIDFWIEKLWLTTKRQSKIETLSKGMKQRVALARAFLHQPHVMLLDEPLAGLDPAGRIQLRQVLSMLREQGCAMIVSSHILVDLEKIATHIAIIEHGRFLRWGRTEELQRHDGERRTFRLQTVTGTDGIVELLESIEGIEEVRSDKSAYLFELGDGVDDNRIAAVLRQIVKRGVPVVTFESVDSTLEHAYLKAGVKQVD